MLIERDWRVTMAVGRTSFTVRCAVCGPRGEGAAVEVDTTHAYVRHGGHVPGRGVTFERQPLPAWLRKPLEDERGQSGQAPGRDGKGGER